MAAPSARLLPARARHAQQEASDRLAGRYDVRVLEPSPPAVHDPPWFADDPLDPGQRRDATRELVSPVSSGDLLWEDLARGDEALEAFCRERWLGPYARLPAVGAGLIDTRTALHRVAEQVIAPARQQANGKIGLRYTLGGFGTPFFADDMQIRVVGDALTVQSGQRAQESRLTTLTEAAELVGFDLARSDTPIGAEALDVDADAGRFIGEWFGFGASVLEQLRVEAEPADEPGRVQLWPEHFDLALELGAQSEGRRAAYGCSPGDERHPEPYLYVAPWTAAPHGALWQAQGFSGAELAYASLLEAGDQRGAALAFFGDRVADLRAA